MISAGYVSPNSSQHFFKKSFSTFLKNLVFHRMVPLNINLTESIGTIHGCFPLHRKTSCIIRKRNTRKAYSSQFQLNPEKVRKQERASCSGWHIWMLAAVAMHEKHERKNLQFLQVETLEQCTRCIYNRHHSGTLPSTEAKPNKHTLSHTMASLAVAAFHPVLLQLGDSHMYTHTHHSAVLCVRQRSNKMESWPALPFTTPHCFHGDGWQTTARGLCHQNA